VKISRFVPRCFGFVHHSIAILYHEVPNPNNTTIRNFFIAVRWSRSSVALLRTLVGANPAPCFHGALPVPPRPSRAAGLLYFFPSRAVPNQAVARRRPSSVGASLACGSRCAQSVRRECGRILMCELGGAPTCLWSTRFVTSLPTDNCPQPKETLPAVSTLTLPY
jgi:hypothetical protein